MNERSAKFWRRATLAMTAVAVLQSAGIAVLAYAWRYQIVDVPISLADPEPDDVVTDARGYVGCKNGNVVLSNLAIGKIGGTYLRLDFERLTDQCAGRMGAVGR